MAADKKESPTERQLRFVVQVFLQLLSFVVDQVTKILGPLLAALDLKKTVWSMCRRFESHGQIE